MFPLRCSVPRPTLSEMSFSPPDRSSLPTSLSAESLSHPSSLSLSLSPSPSSAFSVAPSLSYSSSSPPISIPLSSPSHTSKKRLRPHSTTDLHCRDPSLSTPSPSSPDPRTADASLLLSVSPSPPPSSHDFLAPASSTSSFASSKRRAASDTSLSSLDHKTEGSTSSRSSREEGQGNLQTLLQDSSDDEEEGEEEEEEEGEDDDDSEVDEDEEEEEKSPPRASTLTPLSSMASAAAASALSPLTGPHPPPHLLHSHPSLADSPSEFSSQLFVIYMPKSNFKRFVISSLNTTIIRASKGEKQPVPRMNFPSVHPARPIIPPLSSPTNPTSVPTSSKPSSSSSPDSEFTYNVSMEDVLSCLEAHGVRYNTAFMWMDLSDFGLRFIQQMMGDSTPAALREEGEGKTATDKDDQYGGLWYNVVHKSHLVVNHFAHPFLGDGYAVVITLDLLDSKGGDLTPALSSERESAHTQTITVANDTLYKATKNINEGGITAHPALLTSTSNPPSSLSPFSPPSHPAPPSDPPSRRKVRPVESIGEMLDRIGEYQRIRSQVKSKNKACEKLGYSKGTINAYREKVKQALQLGVDLNQVRTTKYRDFKRVLAAHQAGGVGLGGGAGMGVAVREKGGSGKKEEGGMKKRSNSFGDLGIALMARQDAKNGRKKGKAHPQGDEGGRSKKNEEEEGEEGEGDVLLEEDRHGESPSVRLPRRPSTREGPYIPSYGSTRCLFRLLSHSSGAFCTACSLSDTRDELLLSFCPSSDTRPSGGVHSGLPSYDIYDHGFTPWHHLRVESCTGWQCATVDDVIRSAVRGLCRSGLWDVLLCGTQCLHSNSDSWTQGWTDVPGGAGAACTAGADGSGTGCTATHTSHHLHPVHYVI